MGFDTVTQGYPQPNQVVGPQGSVLDRVNNLAYTFGQSATLALLRSALAVLGVQTALTAITTAQTLLSYAFGAGALNVLGRTLLVRGSLIYSTTSANVATITIAVKLGSVTIATITTAATNTTASTNLPVQFEFYLTVAAVGASGTLVGIGRVDANIGTAAAAAVASYLATTTAASSAVNLLTAETLTVTIAGGAAIPSAQLLNATVEVLA